MFRLLLLSGFLFLGIAPSRAELLVHDGQKVAFLGDSITQFGWGEPGGYVRLVAAGLEAAGAKIVPVPAGVSGNTSKDMLTRLDKDVLSQHPDWMTLSCGVNDVWHGAAGVDLETYKKNIASIVDQAQAAGIKVMILTATGIYEDLGNDLNAKLAPYNDSLRQLAAERKLPLADLGAAWQDALRANPPPVGTLLLTRDGVHPNPAGNLLMARGVLRAFGLADADMPKVEAAWDTIHNGGQVNPRLGPAYAGITLGQYEALQRLTEARHSNVAAFTDGLLLAAMREALAAQEGAAAPDLGKFWGDTRTRFEALVAQAADAERKASAP